MQHRPSPLSSRVFAPPPSRWPPRGLRWPMRSTSTTARLLEDDPKRLACYDARRGRTPRQKRAGSARCGTRGRHFAIGLIARLAADRHASRHAASSLDERWDLDGAPSPQLFALRPYKPIYILPAFYSSSPNLHPTSPNPENNAHACKGRSTISKASSSSA